MKKSTKYVEDYFNKPMFNFIYKWEAIKLSQINKYNKGSNRPCANKTEILWKSKTTGVIRKKMYDYQIN